MRGRSSACRRRRRSRSASRATSDDPGVMLAIRDSDGSPQGAVLRHTDGNPAQRDVHLEAPGVAGRRAPGDVHASSSDAPAERRADARDPGRPREQAAAGADTIRQASTRAARCSAIGGTETLPLGVRATPHGCPHRAVALGARDHADHVPDARALPERDPGPGPGEVPGGKTWVRIRLAVLPNGTTGWVPRGALAAFQKVHTRMVIVQRSLRATLYKRGRPVFSARIGVGQAQHPTPRGEFYVREKLSGYYSPAYGPRAFGLNARSNNADRLARRRLRRHPRDERAADPPGSRLAWLCADAEPAILGSSG